MDVTDVISNLKQHRENVDQHFSDIYSEAVRLANIVSVKPSTPRTASHQIHRNNTPASSPEEYFKITIVVTLLDTIIMEMEIRFNVLSEKASKPLFLVSSILCNDSINFDEASFLETVNFYSGDIH